MPAATAPSHPVVLGAAALLVLNDFVLRGWAPGWFTGKASDVAWLVVVPVVLAAVLVQAGARDRLARAAAVVATAAFYALLQLWPPLGAWLRAGHVADAEDLLVLPALLGAVIAWRGSATRAPGGPRLPRSSALALPVLAASLAADDWSYPPDASWPCGSDMSWDAADPLVLRVAAGWAPTDTDAFLRGTRLLDPDGVEVPLVTARGHLCARDGLRGDTDYTWIIGPWQGGSSNQVDFEHAALPTVRFHTTPGDGPPAATAEACLALVVDLDWRVQNACDPWAQDTGGDTRDTADSADTGAP